MRMTARDKTAILSSQFRLPKPDFLAWHKNLSEYAALRPASERSCLERGMGNPGYRWRGALCFPLESCAQKGNINLLTIEEKNILNRAILLNQTLLSILNNLYYLQLTRSNYKNTPNIKVVKKSYI